MNAPATRTAVQSDSNQPNEWVALDQLARCEAFMRRLADRACVS